MENIPVNPFLEKYKTVFPNTPETPMETTTPVPSPSFPWINTQSKKEKGYGIPSFKSKFTVPEINYGEYSMNVRKLMDEMKQKGAVTGTEYSPQVMEAMTGEALGIGGRAASEAEMSRKEEIFKGKQIEIAEFQAEQQRVIAEKQLKAQKEQANTGTVICTELYCQKLLSEEVYQADSKYGEIADIEALQGYRLLAYPLAEKMRGSKLITKVVSLLAIPTAYELAHRVDPTIKGTLIGKAVLFIGTPICKRYFRIRRRLEWAIF